MNRKIVTVDTYKRNEILFEDRRNLVMSSDYVPYEFKIAQMLALGEVDKDFIQGNAQKLLSDASNSDNISILDMKGVDGYDIDSHFNRIRGAVFKAHQKAYEEFKEANDKAVEEHYKNKYSKKEDVKNNPE